MPPNGNAGAARPPSRWAPRQAWSVSSLYVWGVVMAPPARVVQEATLPSITPAPPLAYRCTARRVPFASRHNRESPGTVSPVS